MSDRPPLPDTDEPFALLGVSPGADERDLKRAYVRLIKQHRPETAPDAFRRVRAAYEEAVRKLALPGLSESLQASVPVSREDEHEAADPAAPAEDPEEPRRHWGEGELAAHLLVGAPLPPELLCAGEGAVLDRVLVRREIGWASLRRQPDREVALELFDRRLQLLAVAGRSLDLLEQAQAALSPARVLGEPDLERVVLHRLPVAVWEHPGEVAGIFERYATTLGDEDIEYCLFRYERLSYLAETWAMFAHHHEVPEELSTFLRVAPVVDSEYLPTLAARLRSRLRADPAAMLRLLEELHEHSHEVFLEVLELLGEVAAPQRCSFEELPDDEVEALRSTMLDLDTRLAPPRYLICITLASFPVALWLFFAGSSVAQALMFLSAINLSLWPAHESSLYRRFVRPGLIQLAASHGTAPAHVVHWLQQAPSETKRLGKRSEDIENDGGLDALAQLGWVLLYLESPEEP